MPITKKYKNSPLIETICEFQFIHKDQWDATIPGMLYEKIKRDYQIKKQRTDLIALAGIQPDANMSDLTALTQFYNAKEDALVQIGKNILTVNCLKPYPHWEKFKPMILKNFKEYKEISNPVSMRQISFRYINKIDIPYTEGFKVSSFFNFYPHKPEGIIEKMSTLDATIRIVHNDKRDLLVLRIANLVPEAKEHLSFLLQIDFNMNKPEQLKFEELEKWLEEAHTRINNTFEASVTEECKKLFT